MKKCVICKSIFPKEVETVWKYTCHKQTCFNALLRKRNKKKNKMRKKTKLSARKTKVSN